MGHCPDMRSSDVAWHQLRLWRYLFRVALFAACHFGMGRLVFLIPIGNLDVWPLWISAGFSQAVLLAWGRQFFPGVALGTLFLGLQSGIPSGVACLFALNDTMQAIVGVTLLKRSGFQPQLARLQDVIDLVLFAAIAAATVSATLGSGLLAGVYMVEWSRFGGVWLNWWISNITGVLTLMPVLLTARQWRAIAQTLSNIVEVMIWLAISIGVSWFLFCSPTRMEIAPYPLEYLPFPCLIWGALRFGPAGAALSTALITNLATLGVVFDVGPFATNARDLTQVVLSLQAYICVIALTGLTLAAVMAEREEARLSLQIEKERSEHLLLNILPLPIANQLKQDRRTIADSFAEASVLFADIADFTRLSASLTAQELVALLNEIFSEFDRLAERHQLEKIKTIGDAYMVVGGLPFPTANHAEAIADMALDMQAAMIQFSDRYRMPLAMRIGINTGPVVAGVIGTKKFIYDLWGDTVNTASRMESHGIVGQIQVTAATYEFLRHHYDLKPRGPVEIKGKGAILTYLLLGRSIVPTLSEECT